MELHTLTLAARSYALLPWSTVFVVTTHPKEDTPESGGLKHKVMNSQYTLTPYLYTQNHACI